VQTLFTSEQLAEPGIKIANDILRKCVHCGFCTATCPTYVLLGNELDSPRGRIYQYKELLENGHPPTEKLVRHTDRCLGCLSCMTTCPASVDYMHLVDEVRMQVAKTYVRPFMERILRQFLALVLPYPMRFRVALICAQLARPFANLMPGRLHNLMKMTPKKVHLSPASDGPGLYPAEGSPKKRVILMTGCAQKVLRPSINEATIRLLTRHGCDVLVADGAGCCGALVHHMGLQSSAHKAAKTNIKVWSNLDVSRSADAIIINASGCGTTVKDYGFLLSEDADWAERAHMISKKTRDITEFMSDLILKPSICSLNDFPIVTYHSACSMQHGQKITTLPKNLLTKVGFEVREPKESHLCCGSAGTYNILQPDLADQLRTRKLENIYASGGEVIATGNIGCLQQLTSRTAITPALPVVHTVELLDWATGGPKPPGL